MRALWKHNESRGLPLTTETLNTCYIHDLQEYFAYTLCYQSLPDLSFNVNVITM